MDEPQSTNKTKSKVITVRNVVLISLPLLATVLSIIAIVVAISLHKDCPLYKAAEKSMVPNDISHPAESNMDANLAEMKTKLSNTLTSLVIGASALPDNITDRVSEISAKLSKFFSVAFHATLRASPPTIRDGEKVKLNTGNGYDSTTGVFTVPDGSTGLYFFSMHLVTGDNKKVHMQVYRNDEILCGFLEDSQNSRNENGQGSCSVMAKLNAGDRVYIKRGIGTEDYPLYCQYNQCGFTGFLMKPTA